jgi:O-acetyl-ADP-ribose deacetylase (regulator of RNase III)
VTNFIYFKHCNIFDSGCEALVNPVNCVGVMGKGLALQFKKRFPDNYGYYSEACREHEVFLGKMFVTFEMHRLETHVWIVNFPTKLHWRNHSQLSWIADGLDDLRTVIQGYAIRSIAIPALGCGLGGLDWVNVRDMIEYKLADIDPLTVKVYEP